MSCFKCNSEILCESDSVRYTCGHCYHTACILKTKMSIHKPICPACDKGTLIYVRHDNTNATRERGPHLIHYMIAFVLIVIASCYLLFLSE